MLFPFDFDDWPSTHTNQEEMLVPYNGTLSELRFAYEKVFPELKESEIVSQDITHGAVTDATELGEPIKRGASSANAKLHKITYRCIQLPSVQDFEDMTLVGALAEADKDYLDIFNTLPVKLMLKFKWTRFSK